MGGSIGRRARERPKEMLPGLRQGPADHDHRRIENADDVGCDLAENPSRCPHPFNGFGLIDPNQIDNVASILGFKSLRP
jgi:hypothetical protein